MNIYMGTFCLDQFVPDLQVRRIAGGSHWVIHEKSAVVNSYIRDFIEKGREQEGA